MTHQNAHARAGGSRSFSDIECHKNEEKKHGKNEEETGDKYLNDGTHNQGIFKFRGGHGFELMCEIHEEEGEESRDESQQADEGNHHVRGGFDHPLGEHAKGWFGNIILQKWIVLECPLPNLLSVVMH